MKRRVSARLTVVAAIVLAVAGCGSQTHPDGDGSASGPQGVELPVWGDSEEVGPDAMTHGVLEGDPDEGCVWLAEGLEEGEDLDPTMALMWRDGYVFDTSTMEVLDPDGEPVAKVGDRVALGGGEVPHFAMDRCEASDRIWVVTSVESS